MSGTHLTPAERERLFELKMAEHSNAEVARQMGRHRSTIGRELERFKSHESWPACGRYFPCYAQGMAVARRAEARGSYWTRHRPLVAYVLRGLRREWSPEQISRRVVLDHPDDGEMRVSHTAIYAHVRADRLAGGTLSRRLRQGRRARRKQYGTGAGASRIPNRVPIAQRPPEVETRGTWGHWEADTVLGVNGRLGTFVERRSRYLLVAPLADGTAAALNAGARRAFAKVPASCRKTMTSDNGSEFAGHGQLAAKLGLATYFADPYSAWQRGTNENTNGLLRQYFPKGHDFSATTPRQVARVAEKLNNRPRKCLAYQTPAEVLGPLLQLKS